MLHIFKRPLHPRLQADDEAPIILKLILRAKDLRLRRVHLRHISLQPRQQLIAHRRLLRADGQQVGDLVQLPPVVEQQMPPRQLNSIARHLRRHKRIAVAVAANPRAKAEHLRQCQRLNLQPVRRTQRLGDLAIKAGQRLKNRDVIVVQPHLDLVVNAGPPRAHLVGLPQAGDLRHHQLLQPRHLLLGHRNAVQRRQKFPNPPPLEHHRPPRRLSRMRGKHRHNQHPPQPLQSFFRADPHAPHLAQRSSQRPALPPCLPAQLQRHAAAACDG